MLILQIIWNRRYKNSGPSSSTLCTLPFSQFDISKSIVFSTCWLKCRFRKAPEVRHDQLMVNKWKILPVLFFSQNLVKFCQIIQREAHSLSGCLCVQLFASNRNQGPWTCHEEWLLLEPFLSCFACSPQHEPIWSGRKVNFCFVL